MTRGKRTSDSQFIDSYRPRLDAVASSWVVCERADVLCFVLPKDDDRIQPRSAFSKERLFAVVEADRALLFDRSKETMADMNVCPASYPHLSSFARLGAVEIADRIENAEDHEILGLSDEFLALAVSQTPHTNLNTDDKAFLGLLAFQSALVYVALDAEPAVPVRALLVSPYRTCV